MDKHQEKYKLATDITMFLTRKLNEHGIKTVVVSQQDARGVLAKEHSSGNKQLDDVDFY